VKRSGIALAVLLAIGGWIRVPGYVYAEMRREPILSKLTSTIPGRTGMGLLAEVSLGGRDSHFQPAGRPVPRTQQTPVLLA